MFMSRIVKLEIGDIRKTIFIDMITVCRSVGARWRWVQHAAVVTSGAGMQG